jgi:hypothetical protein
MTIQKFSDEIYLLRQNTSPELLALGEIIVTAPMSLAAVRLNIFIHGTLGGSETCTLKLFSDENLEGLMAQSDAFALQDIEGLSEYWNGWLRFDFPDGPTLDVNESFCFAMETSNYTQNGDTFYIGWALDWPFNTNGLPADPLQRGAYMEFYEYR